MSVFTHLLLPLTAVSAPGTDVTGFHGSEALIFVQETPEIRVIPRLEADPEEVRLTEPFADMPVIEPDPASDYKLVVATPDPTIDYKLRVIE